MFLVLGRYARFLTLGQVTCDLKTKKEEVKRNCVSKVIVSVFPFENTELRSILTSSMTCEEEVYEWNTLSLESSSDTRSECSGLVVVAQLKS